MVFTAWDPGTEVEKRKQRKEGRGGPKSLVEQGYFIHGSMCLYIVIQGSFRQKKISLSENTETKRITTVTKGITTVMGR